MLCRRRPPWRLTAGDADAIIVHCIGPDTPWYPGAALNDEWHRLFSMADQVDLDDVPEGKIWSKTRLGWRDVMMIEVLTPRHTPSPPPLDPDAGTPFACDHEE